MFQRFVTSHSHPQDFSRRIVATTSATGGSIVCLNDNLGKAVSATDVSWISSVLLTGGASPSGFYVAHALERLPGSIAMVGVCSVAAALGNLPSDAIMCAFTTTLDLATGPTIPLSDPTLTIMPLQLGGSPPAMSMVDCFDVLNDKQSASYFGIFVFGSFTATARTVSGGISLRQVTNEYPTFQPSK